MEKERDYFRDIAEIRSMMERSSKFLSLSGWAGVMAGIYALAGAYLAYTVLDFNPDEILYGGTISHLPENFLQVIILAMVILVLAVSTAVFFSHKNANKRGENAWNATSRRLLIHMAIPLTAGGILILVLISKGLVGLIAPMSLLFYGLALYNASKFTYDEVKILGIIQMTLGLISAYYIEYGLLFWAVGFGLVHIGYGIYIHYRYER